MNTLRSPILAFLLAGIAVLGAGLLPAPVSADVQKSTLMPLSSFPQEPIAVETRGARRHVFNAWRAETSAQREQGLMFVKSMPAEQAMIFVYDPPAQVAMWMKNTILPLDMLFVDAGGCIVYVKERARPGSLANISTNALIALVVELNAGTAASRGIGVGDRVVRPAAEWPAAGQACINRR
jgi:hypothetical protein